MLSFKNKALSWGNYHVGPYCGARVYRRKDWKLYGVYRKTSSGFSVGPVLFWKEDWDTTPAPPF